MGIGRLLWEIGIRDGDISKASLEELSLRLWKVLEQEKKETSSSEDLDPETLESTSESTPVILEEDQVKTPTKTRKRKTACAASIPATAETIATIASDDKTTVASEVLEEDATDVADKDSAEPVKRKRGRPKKKANDGGKEVTAETTISSTEVVEKKPLKNSAASNRKKKADVEEGKAMIDEPATDKVSREATLQESLQETPVDIVEKKPLKKKAGVKEGKATIDKPATESRQETPVDDVVDDDVDDKDPWGLFS